MWNRRSFFAYIRVRVKDAKGEKRNIRIALPFSLLVLHQLLLSIDGVLSLIPGKPGRQARMAMDTIHLLLYSVIESEPQKFVHIDVQEKESMVKVDMATFGLGGGEQK